MQLSSSADFDEAVTSHRRELLAHCYRMLGSPHDAEDALQEALVGAWKGWAGFEGRSSVRTWLFRIATNACLRHAQRRPARVLSTDLGPGFTQTADLGRPDTEHLFLEPWSDEPDDAGDPEAAYARREGVELAYVAALQHLPPTQRAVLLLREVLQFSAAEVAELLDTSSAGVNSALQRARATLREHLPAGRREDWTAPGELSEAERELLEGFIDFHERGDAEAAVALLAEDIRITMPPHPYLYEGREAIAPLLERAFGPEEAMGDWRLVPTRANRMPAAASYLRRPGEAELRAFKIDVLRVRDGRIAEITTFDATLFEAFGLERTLRA